MLKLAIVPLWLVPLASFAQEVPQGVTPGGTINGKPISTDVFTVSRAGPRARLQEEAAIRVGATMGRGLAAGPEPAEKEIQAGMLSDVCGKLRSLIDRKARQQAVRDFGITASKEEMEAARAGITKPDPVVESNRIRGQAQAVAAALAAVDRGADPHQAWLEYLKPIGYDEPIWNANLSVTRTPERRAKFNEQLARQLATRFPEA